MRCSWFSLLPPLLPPHSLPSSLSPRLIPYLPSFLPPPSLPSCLSPSLLIPLISLAGGSLPTSPSTPPSASPAAPEPQSPPTQATPPPQTHRYTQHMRPTPLCLPPTHTRTRKDASVCSADGAPRFWSKVFPAFLPFGIKARCVRSAVVAPRPLLGRSFAFGTLTRLLCACRCGCCAAGAVLRVQRRGEPA